ncbi:4'-phosphopantetheinyl transferase family protein [Bacteroides sp. UBA939]|uniref:4'-phosphopantetheinyl transferase family protein n=1 Tax=Bacteroides sp. UBA939 TaxID=1946092 RepID=UPI0025B94B44|nr:4'-phosphopantetheinyl transferase family protein [Bacteroides sp. UBA939]
MPLFIQHIESSYRLGVWKMDETLDELLDMLPQREIYLQEMQRFSAEHRRLEWLSVRMLLFTLLGEEKTIAYYPSGKPYLADKSASISISHTRGYVSVIIGEAGKEVGIDIEHYGERVHKVAHKYMRTDEILSSYQGTGTWALLLHWSAKEVMFKCMNASDVDFREHLHIFPFIVAEKGVFLAEEYRTPEQRKFEIHYILHPDFVLTWQGGF